jgi:DNA-binding winged helix-turn-helix (wHTH) protein/Tol biopolymer transport system component
MMLARNKGLTPDLWSNPPGAVPIAVYRRPSLEELKEHASRITYSFGPFHLDPVERRLVRDGRDLRVPPKVFETLVLLVERHGRLVEKDDLMTALWPGMFVEEVTLAQNISLLRKALGDVPGQDESQYIATVSKRGYRFIAHVKRISQPVAGTESASLSMPAVSGRGSRAVRIAWAALAVLVGTMGALGVAYFKLKNADPPVMVVRSAILPPMGGEFGGVSDPRLGAPAVSQDGKQLVSAVRDNRGNPFLWLHNLNESGEGRRLPGTEGGGHPFWSPDGRSIGFFASGKLKRIDSDGSGLQILCDAAGGGRGGAWSSGGIIIFTPSLDSPLYEIPANGSTPKQITHLNTDRGETSHRWPVFLADGRNFLFFVRSNFNPEIIGVYAGSLNSQNYHMVVRTALGPAFEAGGTMLYVRDGVLLAQTFDERKLVTTGEPTVLQDRVGFNPRITRALFSASRAGVLAYYPASPSGLLTLTWYDHDGKRGDPLGTGNLYAPALSPDGTHAVVTIDSADGLGSDLWSFDLTRGTKTRLTSGPGYNQVAVWQPDGQFVFFTSLLKNGTHISRIKSDGTGPLETVLETARVTEFPTSVCRDGRYLASVRIPTNSLPSVWVLPLIGDRKPFALIQSQFGIAEAAFSPNCKWVAYISNETGQPEVYITHFSEPSRKYQVSTQGGALPRWRGDGKELFYFSRPQNTMMAVNVDEKAGELSLGPPRTLFHLANNAENFSLFDVTPDGQRFLISETNSPSGTVPLTLVTNWEAELKKR